MALDEATRLSGSGLASRAIWGHLRILFAKYWRWRWLERPECSDHKHIDQEARELNQANL